MQTQQAPATEYATTPLRSLDADEVEALEAQVVEAEIEPALDRPAGPAAAVLLATGLSSLTLGVLTGLVAAFPGVESALTISQRVGDLSGVSIITIAVFFGIWGLMTAVWRRSTQRDLLRALRRRDVRARHSPDRKHPLAHRKGSVS
jgi:hypothetical protein